MLAAELARLRREQLSDFLRQLRTASGLTATKVAEGAAMSQSKLSKIEHGTLLPTRDDISRLGRVLSADEHVRIRLADMADSVSRDASPTRVVLHRGGERHQLTVARAVHQAEVTQMVAVTVIPPVLQAPGYDLAAIGLGHSGENAVDLAALAQRRQRLLDDQKRHFTVLLAEGALRSPLGSASVMLQQIQHLASVMEHANVELGIIPWHVLTDGPTYCGFEVYDGRMVLVDLANGNLVLTDPVDVRGYVNHLEALRRNAIFGSEARDLLLAIGNDYPPYITEPVVSDSDPRPVDDEIGQLVSVWPDFLTAPALGSYCEVFGEALTHIRENRRGLLAADVCRLTGISPTSICKVEKGERKLSLSMLDTITRCYRIDMIELLVRVAKCAFPDDVPLLEVGQFQDVGREGTILWALLCYERSTPQRS